MDLKKDLLSEQYLIFMLEEQRFALPVGIIKVVVRMVEIIPVPGAEEFVGGVINYHGDIIPVVDLKRKLGFSEKSFDINNHMIIIQYKGRYSALVVDKVMEVVTYHDETIKSISEIAPQSHFYRGMTKHADGIILLNKLEDVLPEETSTFYEEFIKQEEDVPHDA